jgi:hypothetical protein
LFFLVFHSHVPLNGKIPKWFELKINKADDRRMNNMGLTESISNSNPDIPEKHRNTDNTEFVVVIISLIVVFSGFSFPCSAKWDLKTVPLKENTGPFNVICA